MQCTATLHEQADTDDDEDLFRSFRSTTVKRGLMLTSRRNSVLSEKAHQNMFLKINNDL